MLRSSPVAEAADKVRFRQRGASAELLGQSDEDALRAAHEAEPVDVLVLRDLVDELGTVVAQAGDDVVDVVDGEAEVAERPVT